MWVARFPWVGALVVILVTHSVGAYAWLRPVRDTGSYSPYEKSRGIVGLGFGFGPWWGPYDAYAPPAYAYPPPVYALPPPLTIPGMLAPPQRGVCQQFQSMVIVNGQSRMAKGVACPQPDGSWRIVQ